LASRSLFEVGGRHRRLDARVRELSCSTTRSTAAGLTQLAAIGATGVGDVGVTAIVGATDTVYANGDTIALASRAWGDPLVRFGVATASAGSGSVSAGGGSTGSGGAGGGSTTTKPAALTTIVPPGPQTLDFTHLHLFDIARDPTSPTYVGSGTVAGQIEDQFSLDARNGLLRVATTEQRWSADDAQTSVRGRLFVLRADGDALQIIGDAGDIATGERVYSTRFVGDRGYVVTFRRVDPLFVFDLSDPTKPTKRGELELPGFSTYMHPLDASHLLTIGQDGDETGRVRGVALRIFEVGDPSAPKLAHVYTFRDADYGYSEAAHDHHAFTFFPARGLLTIPFVAYGTQAMRSTAEVFRVDLNAGLERLGAIDHSALFAATPRGFCGGYFGPQVRRGVFLEDVLVSISYGGVVAADTRNLAAAPIPILPLQPPDLPGAPKCGASPPQ
jgi:hypothetical protein